jgi:hypothetical protein
MKRRVLHIFVFLILGSLFGFLAFTPSENAGDQDYLFDGFLDFYFDLESQSPSAVSPFLETHPDTDTHLFLFCYLGVSYFQSVNLLTNMLRL